MEARLLKHPLFLRLSEFLPYVGWALLSAWILINAWVAEDAYITFRVIDNFLNGYGLRWNIHERVQVFTHPLWLFAQVPFAAAFGNLFLANIAVSVLCSAGALYLVISGTKRPVLACFLFFLLPLLLSKSFMDYSASGLENPLSFLLFAWFGHVVVNQRAHPHFWLLVSLSVSLSLFNRLDTALLYAPIMAYLLWEQRRQVRWQQLALGTLPLLYWLLFSLWYYGFLFPNTKYAKLNTGIEWGTYLLQGVEYIKHLLIYDMESALLLLAGMAAFLPALAAHLRQVESLPKLPQAVAAGVLCYCLYTVSIGGDYMAGRFWALPVFVSVWLLYVFMPVWKRGDVPFVFLCLLCAPMLITPSLQEIRKACPPCLKVNNKIIDAARTFSDNRFIGSLWPLYYQTAGSYTFGRDGKKLADKSIMSKKAPVGRLYFIGMSGYYAGPKAQLIDQMALADPLMARLPADPERAFHISHYKRVIPKGYEHALQTGDLGKMNHKLAKYYDKLRLITSGELLNKERLKTIVRFNLGYYDHFRDEYVANQSK